MAKPRLHEIAKELGIKSSDVVAAAMVSVSYRAATLLLLRWEWK